MKIYFFYKKCSNWRLLLNWLIHSSTLSMQLRNATEDSHPNSGTRVPSSVASDPNLAVSVINSVCGL